MSVHYTTDFAHWNKVLDASLTREALAHAVAEWSPYVDDALAVVAAMDDEAFLRFRSGLRKERRGQFAGESWAVRFGELLMPEKLLEASRVVDQYHVPLGLALIRIAESKAGK